MSRNLVLTGFMGTGKTTVGRIVAEALEMRFVDTDGLIVARYGPVPEIFRVHGEARFREIEREVAIELAAQHGVVIATGGRLLLDPANAAVLGASGEIVCLVASIDTIAARVIADGIEHRPILAGASDPGAVRARVAELLAERAAAYAQFTQIVTDDQTPTQISNTIIKTLTQP